MSFRNSSSEVDPALRQGTALKALRMPFMGVFRIYPSRSFSDLCSAAENEILYTALQRLKACSFPFLFYSLLVQKCHYENRQFHVVSG